jgi:hypothetical protein
MEPDLLLKRRRKQRESSVKVGEYTFTIRRPTDEEAALSLNGQKNAVEICSEFVCGWSDNVTEATLVSGGSSDPVPFHSGLWRDWCADFPACWTPITNAISESYEAHRKEIDDAGKA